MMDVADSALADVTLFPFWLDAKNAPATEPQLIGRTTADLLIVGGGFTGLWTAILAKEADPGRDVVLIEAEKIAYGASGRPGGIVSTSIMHGLHNALRIFPGDLKKLEQLGQANMRGFLDTLARHSIDCDAEWNGEMTVAASPEHVGIIHREHELHRTHGHDVDLLDAVATRAQLNSPLFHAGMWSRKNSGTVHPAKLAWGLKKAAKSLGVRLYEQCPMKLIEENGSTLRVTTRDGVIIAPKVLLATGAYAAGHPKIRSRIAMVRDRVLITEPLSCEQMQRVSWANRQGVYDTRTQLNYMRLTKDNRILFGGRLGYFIGSPTDPQADRTIDPYRRLGASFFKTFPQLDDVRFTHAWSGPIDLTTRMAVHFQTYFSGKVVFAGGYSGFGISTSRFGADIGLAKLDGSARPETQMDFACTLPSRIPPEPLRHIGAQITMYALDSVDQRGGWRKPWLKMVCLMGFPLS